MKQTFTAQVTELSKQAAAYIHSLMLEGDTIQVRDHSIDAEDDEDGLDSLYEAPCYYAPTNGDINIRYAIDYIEKTNNRVIVNAICCSSGYDGEKQIIPLTMIEDYAILALADCLAETFVAAKGSDTTGGESSNTADPQISPLA